MKKKKVSQSHPKTAHLAAILIVGGVLGSVFSYMSSIQNAGPEMGNISASANQDDFVISKEIIQAYSNDNLIYLILPDIILNSNIINASQFSVIDNALLNPVIRTHQKGNILILEVKNPLSRKVTTVSYRDGIKGRIYTHLSGYVHSFNEKLVTPVENIDETLAIACEAAVPREITINSSSEDILKLKWHLSKTGFYTSKIDGIYSQDLVNAITKFQIVNAESLKVLGFNESQYGTWTSSTSEISAGKQCN